MIWSVDFNSGAGSVNTPVGGLGAGAESSGNSRGTDTGSGPVYVDSNNWKEKNLGVQCMPPCVLVLSPIILPKHTTISFPHFTTSYIVQSKITEEQSSNFPDYPKNDIKAAACYHDEDQRLNRHSFCQRRQADYFYSSSKHHSFVLYNHSSRLRRVTDFCRLN